MDMFLSVSFFITFDTAISKSSCTAKQQGLLCGLRKSTKLQGADRATSSSSYSCGSRKSTSAQVDLPRLPGSRPPSPQLQLPSKPR